MAHFRGTVQGSRGEASRTGHSVLLTTTDGWHAGITVEARKTDAGTDLFQVFITGGSAHAPLAIAGDSFIIDDGCLTYVSPGFKAAIKQLEEKEKSDEKNINV